MTNHKHTKRALFTSVISMLLCVTMLIGSTFAWFTDTATTGVNKIQAGTLEVAIVDVNDKDLKDELLRFKNVEDKTGILWEPNATFQTGEFHIQNKGNLYLTYKIEINNTEISYNKLNEVIAFSLISADGTEYDLSKEHQLAPNTKSGALKIQGHMSQDADNSYQGLSLDGISITVYAKQATVEKDMTGDQYDAGAEYAQLVFAKDQSDLNTAITNTNTAGPIEVELTSGTYNVSELPIQNKNVTFTGTKDTVFDMSAQQGVNGVPDMTNTSLTFDGVTIKWAENNEGYQGIKNPEKVVYKNCVIEGTQFMYSSADFINCTFIVGSGYAVYTRASGDYSFTGCTFNTGGRAIMMYNDAPITVNVALNNCTFSDNGTYASGNKAVVETGDNPNDPKNTSKFNIVINNCTITEGFEENNSTSKLWGNKNSMPKDRLNVVIDGVDVY